MYLITREGLGQAPKTNPLQEFLDKVRKRPQDYKVLLLNIRLHPFPLNSVYLSNYSITNKPNTNKLIDEILINGSTAEKVLKELNEISDANLQREIEAQRKLWDKTLQALVNLDPSKLRPILLQAALLDPKRVQTPGGDAEYAHQEFRVIGLGVAQELPGSLGQELTDWAEDAHLTRLGHRLANIAILKQQRDSAFKREVDQERQRKLQAGQKRKRQQQRPKKK